MKGGAVESEARRRKGCSEVHTLTRRELSSRRLSVDRVKCYRNVPKLKAEKGSLDMAARGLGIRAKISWGSGEAMEAQAQTIFPEV